MWGEERGDVGFMVGYENSKSISVLFFPLQTVLKSEGRDDSFWTSNKNYDCSLLHFHWILSGLYETWRKIDNFPIMVFIWVLMLMTMALLLSGQVTLESSNFTVQFALSYLYPKFHLMNEHPCLDRGTQCQIHLWLLWRSSHPLSYLPTQIGLLPNSCPTIKRETQNLEFDSEPSPGYMDSFSSY